MSGGRVNQGGRDKEVIIKVRGLVNGFGDKLLHDHLDLDVYRGEVLGVVGGSGTGKSVLLRSIVGLNKIQSGTIEVFGKNTAGLNEAQMRQIEMRWGVLFQEGALFSSQTMAENIQVPLREYIPDVAGPDERDRRDEAVDGRPSRGRRGEISFGTVRRHEEARRTGARARARSRRRFPRRTDGGP